MRSFYVWHYFKKIWQQLEFPFIIIVLEVNVQERRVFAQEWRSQEEDVSDSVMLERPSVGNQILKSGIPCRNLFII